MRLASYYASACMLWLSRACKCDVGVSCTSASSYMTMDGRAKKRAASERDFSIIHFSWNRSRFKPFFRLTLNLFPGSTTLADKACSTTVLGSHYPTYAPPHLLLLLLLLLSSQPCWCAQVYIATYNYNNDWSSFLKESVSVSSIRFMGSLFQSFIVL